METTQGRLKETQKASISGSRITPKHILIKELKTLIKKRDPDVIVLLTELLNAEQAELIEIYPDPAPIQQDLPEHIYKNLRKIKKEDQKLLSTASAHVYFPLSGLHMRGIKCMQTQSNKIFVFFPFGKSQDKTMRFPLLDFENKEKWERLKKQIQKQIRKEY